MFAPGTPSGRIPGCARLGRDISKYPPKLWVWNLTSLVQWRRAVIVRCVAVSSRSNKNAHCLQQRLCDRRPDGKVKRRLTEL